MQFKLPFLILENGYSSNSDDDPTYYPSDSDEHLYRSNSLEDCDDLHPRGISSEQLPEINNTVSVSHIMNIFNLICITTFALM